MDDLSLHILDIAENSLRADATIIEIDIAREGGLLRIEIIDDGRGMDAETLARVRDPFFTTKHKKTGLGIPLLSQAAELTGGSLAMKSAPGRGTRLAASFGWDHVDRPRIGDMAETILTLIAGHPDRDYIYEERDAEGSFRFDTREIKQDLEKVPISDPAVLNAIRNLLRDNIRLKE
ncbi:MAG TPA: ATP-binding protein [Nitrospirota bacterium]|nr:ATP-binding protein [Nitrospirota bacterium]